MGQVGLHYIGLLALVIVTFEGLVLAQPLRSTASIDQVLRDAAFDGQIEILRSGFDQGAKPDAPDPDGRTALMMTSFNGHTETVRLLLDRGAKVDTRDGVGRTADAERVLREGINRAPKVGELYHSLGLLLAEEKRYPEAASNLGTAAGLITDRARVHYNHGLALQHIGSRSGAETALLKAHRLSESDPSTIQALAIFYIQSRQWKRAATYAEQLIRLYPNEPGLRQLLKQIERMKK